MRKRKLVGSWRANRTWRALHCQSLKHKLKKCDLSLRLKECRLSAWRTATGKLVWKERHITCVALYTNYRHMRKQSVNSPVSDIVRLSRDNETSTGTVGTVEMVTDSPLAGMWHCTASTNTPSIRYWPCPKDNRIKSFKKSTSAKQQLRQ